MCLVKVPFSVYNADPLNGCILPLGIMINEEHAIRDAEKHDWPQETDHLGWLAVFEAYAERFPEPGNLVRDLVRTRSEVLDHPELGLPQTDPGIETRFRVLYHGLMHSQNHLTWEDEHRGPMRHSIGVPIPPSPSLMAGGGPTCAGRREPRTRVRGGDHELHSC